MKIKRLLISAVVLLALLSIGPVSLVGAEEPLPPTCIDLEKTGPQTALPGEMITYHFWVHNCGEVVLHGGYDVYDLLLNPDGGSIWWNVLQPDEVHKFDKTYTVPEDTCGEFTNDAWAIGRPLYNGSYLDFVRDDSSWTVDVICGPLCETDLIAGKDWDSPAGVVTVDDDGQNLYVTFDTAGTGWSLGETHLYAGATPPKKSAPGRFPYRSQTEYIIPLGDFEGDTFYIAAHAEVSQGDQQETAWADTYGTLIRNKGWAMYFGYEVGAGCFKP